MNAKPNTPNHVGFIMDGNRRWAKSRGLPAFEGHRRGLNKLFDISDVLIESGIKYVTFYAFSTENWNRTKAEIDYLMELGKSLADRELKRLQRNNIRMVWLGRQGKLDKDVVDSLRRAEKETAKNSRGTVCVCFDYGGQQEITDAFKKLLTTKPNIKDLTPENISENLYHPQIPPLDLIVRTSGEQRLSNFMLWRSAYAELIFIKKHWPAINKRDIEKILAEYASRQRRYGQ